MHLNVHDLFYSQFPHQHVTAAIAAETCWWGNCE
jgi:hypothetical protein